MSSGPGRDDTAPWRRAKRRAIARANGLCQWCSHPLNPDAKARTDEATEVDHIVRLEDGGAPFDLENLRALHRACHLERHRLDDAPPPTPASSAW